MGQQLFNIALAVGLIVGSLGGWYFTAKYKDATWTASIDKQKSEASNPSTYVNSSGVITAAKSEWLTIIKVSTDEWDVL